MQFKKRTSEVTTKPRQKAIKKKGPIVADPL